MSVLIREKEISSHSEREPARKLVLMKPPTSHTTGCQGHGTHDRTDRTDNMWDRKEKARKEEKKDNKLQRRTKRVTNCFISSTAHETTCLS